MPSIAIVGAGHAGVEAAFTLAKAGCAVTLWSNEASLPYSRPRLIAVAFSSVAPEKLALKPEGSYREAGITLVREPVTTLDRASCAVNGQVFDGIILAQGARPVRPPFAGEGAQRVRTLWSMEEARQLADVARPGKKLTVIGGGVLGLEAAVRAAEASLAVTVIEAAPHVLGGRLGDAGEACLLSTLAEKGIRVVRGKGVAEVLPEGVKLADGTVLPDDLLLCAIGARANTRLAEDAGFPSEQGLRTGLDLSLAPRIYAAGDIARPTSAPPVCAALRAQRMGALAAQNLLAELQGRTTTPWEEPRLPLMMKVGTVELYLLGDCTSPDLSARRIDDGHDPRILQEVLFRGESPVGLRFIGARTGFGEWEARLAR